MARMLWLSWGAMPTIAVHRLRSQLLEQTSLRLPHEVVAWFAAVQAQDYPGAKWSVGLRLPGSTEAGIEQAIADKTIIRTWAVRGTLHFVAAADARWLLALVAPRIVAGNVRRYRELELDEPTLARSSTLLASALEGGKQLTRTEMLAVLEQSGISTQGQRAAYMLQRASLDGLIGQGVMRRNNPTYLSLEGSLPASRVLARDEAIAELVRRYFTSRAPATLQDFVWWSGLPVSDAKAGLEAIKSQLIEATIDGQTVYLHGSMPAAQGSAPAAYLLPGFDEYLLSYRDRSASLDAQHVKKVAPGGGMFRPTLMVGGRVVGTWKRAFKRGAVAVTTNPFATLTAAEEHAVTAAARRYSEFLDIPMLLT